ncbi:DUF202 domain-containing protein [Rhodococcus sp. 14C212]|uniref:DUF202 domain-containing protein n=1 Tax=Rhodococcus sp. 14C212 TaxID=2711209 RepID=UPI0013EC54B5|nr:DUF202 domain-containing protein [Rhodococcus sp. 14C212]NGP05138.1 DUF202 domain-containing protein [Rhodococcus sp. 14C212]
MRQDVGLANERTTLSWQRTALSLIAGVAVIVRVTGVDRGLGLVVVLACTALLGGSILKEGQTRYSHTVGIRQRPRGRTGLTPLVLSLLVFLTGVAVLVTILA